MFMTKYKLFVVTLLTHCLHAFFFNFYWMYKIRLCNRAVAFVLAYQQICVHVFDDNWVELNNFFVFFFETLQNNKFVHSKCKLLTKTLCLFLELRENELWFESRPAECDFVAVPQLRPEHPEAGSCRLMFWLPKANNLIKFMIEGERVTIRDTRGTGGAPRQNGNLIYKDRCGCGHRWTLRRRQWSLPGFKRNLQFNRQRSGQTIHVNTAKFIQFNSSNLIFIHQG